MSDLSDEPEDLFPTHGPIDEPHQIGRTTTIVALTNRVRDHSDALLLHPRKVGKTSVARAALARLRSDHGGVAAEVDCTAAEINDGPSLARGILRALADGGGIVSRLLRTRSAVSRQSQPLRRLRKPVESVGDLGVEEAKVFGRVLELLQSDGPPLGAIFDELIRLGEQKPTALFIDEVQAVAKWSDRDEVQAALARFMHRNGRRVAVVAAGSEASATEELFAYGQPLHWEFEPFDLPDIDRVDWHRGLVERFRHAGHPIAAARIDQMLGATDGHPLRTMSVAKQTLRETREAGEAEVTWTAVDAAIAQARRHPSWNS